MKPHRVTLMCKTLVNCHQNSWSKWTSAKLYMCKTDQGPTPHRGLHKTFYDDYVRLKYHGIHATLIAIRKKGDTVCKAHGAGCTKV